MKISGSIQPKRNKWFMVISRYDEFGKRHRQWKSTELPALEKHKNAAKKMLDEWLMDVERRIVSGTGDRLFSADRASRRRT